MYIYTYQKDDLNHNSGKYCRKSKTNIDGFANKQQF